ncbi:MAG: BON domain-containing protein [Nevskia sp.]|nr:BON domain-containing protein [Nevskia sp.]
MVEDFNLRQRVMEELDYEPAVDAAHIGVSVKDGVVTLTGSVETATQRAQAEAAVRRVKGVRAVAQEIRVNIPSHKKTADDEIASRAVQVLDWAMHPAEPSLQVTVDQGHVTLTGEVSWGYQRRRAEECVEQLGGVSAVINRITIRPRVAPSDIRLRIQSALERSADLDAAGITIDIAENGTAVLRGRVRSLHEQIMAENAALSAPGIIGVENHLRVVP